MAWLLLIWLNILILVWQNVSARDVSPKKENYLPNYQLYHNVSRIDATIKRLLNSYPESFIRHRNFKSGKGRNVFVLKLPADYGSNVSNNERVKEVKRVLMVFGEHAREFMPTESALFFLQHVLSNPESPQIRLLRKHFEVYIIPLLNPDGRVYIERTSNYCWRGTASGVDLSRNFPWEYGSKTGGSSMNRDDEEYRGATSFSEMESRIIRDLSKELAFDAAISFHSGIRHIYVPYSDSVSRKTGRKPEFWELMNTLARRMKNAMGNNPNHAFQAGPAAKLNDYAADGTMFDYLAGVRHVPVSLAVELWGAGDVPGVKCFDLFNPPSNSLVAELQRLLPLYDAFFSGLWSLRANFTVQKSRTLPVSQPASLPPYPLIALLAIILLILGLLCKHRLRASHNSWRLLASGRKRVVSLRSFSNRFSGLTGLKSV